MFIFICIVVQVVFVVVAHEQTILNQLLFLWLSCRLLQQANLYQRNKTMSISSESVVVLETPRARQYVFISSKLKHYVTCF